MWKQSPPIKSRRFPNSTRIFTNNNNNNNNDWHLELTYRVSYSFFTNNLTSSPWGSMRSILRMRKALKCDFSTCCSVPPCKEIRIPECGKGLLVKSRIGKNFAHWIRNRGLWNPGIQLKESGISLNDWNPEYEFHWQRLESSMWNPNLWYGIQDPRPYWIPLNGAISALH